MVSYNHWIKKDPADRIERINKKIVIPSFSVDTGPTRQSLQFKKELSSYGFGSGASLAANFTVDAIVKNLGAVDDIQTIFEMWMNPSATVQVRLSIINGKARLSCFHSGGTEQTLDSDDGIGFDTWTRISATWDGTTMKLWINGKEQTTTAAPGAALDTDSFYEVHMGGTGTGVPADQLSGLIDEIRVWTVVKDDVFLGYNFIPYVASDDTGLALQYKFNDTGTVILSTIEFEESANGYNITFVAAAVSLSTDASLMSFGASFVAAEYNVTTSESCALVYPVKPPADNNFGLVVRWDDDDGNVQRRMLFNTSDSAVKWSPPLANYAGELLPTSFTLEIMTHPTKVSVDLDSDFTLYLSITTQPTTSNDRTAVAEATLTADTTLAEPFSLTDFPLEFNTQQTY